MRVRVGDARRRHALRVRGVLESSVRKVFEQRGFLEVRTPALVHCPGMEPHIVPFEVRNREGQMRYLHTSPEFAMKRLLVGGLEQIFQIASVYRDEPRSPQHRCEFTMLEWYRAGGNESDIQEDVEALVCGTAMELGLGSQIRWNDQSIDLIRPWPRARVSDLVREFSGVELARYPTQVSLARECERLGVGPVNLTRDTWDDCFFRIWLNLVEPKLSRSRPLFVTHYPPSQAALAQVVSDEQGERYARRFELYLGGMELANAFYELTDPEEQRRRFVADQALRKQQYGDSVPHPPLDEAFLAALEEGMPPACGIALGLDRLVMILANEPDIDRTFWI